MSSIQIYFLKLKYVTKTLFVKDKYAVCHVQTELMSKET